MACGHVVMHRDALLMIMRLSHGDLAGLGILLKLALHTGCVPVCTCICLAFCGVQWWLATFVAHGDPLQGHFLRVGEQRDEGGGQGHKAFAYMSQSSINGDEPLPTLGDPAVED